jgi:mannose-6-phosphate isomerase
MAASDNVVRAGLTPKFRDVSVLCEMLTYAARRPPIQRGDALDTVSRVFPTPVPEFVPTQSKVPAGTSVTDDTH